MKYTVSLPITKNDKYSAFDKKVTICSILYQIPFRYKNCAYVASIYHRILINKESYIVHNLMKVPLFFQVYVITRKQFKSNCSMLVCESCLASLHIKYSFPQCHVILQYSIHPTIFHPILFCPLYNSVHSLYICKVPNLVLSLRRKFLTQ